MEFESSGCSIEAMMFKLGDMRVLKMKDAKLGPTRAIGISLWGNLAHWGPYTNRHKPHRFSVGMTIHGRCINWPGRPTPDGAAADFKKI